MNAPRQENDSLRTIYEDQTISPKLQVVLDAVRSRRAEFDSLRHIPKDVIELFKAAGIYRSAVARRFGGDALPPAEFLRMIELISAEDGSAGWVASFGSAHVYLAALPIATLEKLYANGPDVVFGGGLFPVQPAEKTEGGWKVTGTWKFASGCKGADWLGVGIGGAPGEKPRTAVFPAAEVEIVDNWDVMGLKGTGSHDLKVGGKLVSDEWTFIRGGAATIDEPLYRYPSIAYAAQVLAVVNLGLARAALDEISRVSGGKTGITGAPKLADRAYFRIEVAKAEAKLRSARLFFYESTESAWRAIERGDALTTDQINLLRLSAIEVSKVGCDTVNACFRLAGTAAINSSHPLQRYLRDALVVNQHAFLGEGLYDAAGAVLLGVPPMPGYI